MNNNNHKKSQNKMRQDNVKALIANAFQLKLISITIKILSINKKNNNDNNDRDFEKI